MTRSQNHSTLDDEALSTDDAARVCGVTPTWLKLARQRGDGPKFARLSPRKIRYLRSDLIAWLRTRGHTSTSEYAGRAESRR